MSDDAKYVRFHNPSQTYLLNVYFLRNYRPWMRYCTTWHNSETSDVSQNAEGFHVKNTKKRLRNRIFYINGPCPCPCILTAAPDT